MLIPLEEEEKIEQEEQEQEAIQNQKGTEETIAIPIEGESDNDEDEIIVTTEENMIQNISVGALKTLSEEGNIEPSSGVHLQLLGRTRELDGQVFSFLLLLIPLLL